MGAECKGLHLNQDPRLHMKSSGMLPPATTYAASDGDCLGVQKVVQAPAGHGILWKVGGTCHSSG